jgi:hypothetical protein
MRYRRMEKPADVMDKVAHSCRKSITFMSRKSEDALFFCTFAK